MNSHAPHIPHIAHQEVGGSRGLGQWIAVFTTIVATIAAIVGHEAGEMANNAILHKNESVLRKAEASNQWAYYQAVSNKSHLMELARTLAPHRDEHYAEKLAKYASQKEEIRRQAEALENASKEANEKSASYAHPRELLIVALGLLQVAIAVASVTMLTERRWLFFVALAGGIAGSGISAYAFLLH